MATCNGYRNWNHWNVALWINNDETLYRMAQQFIRRALTRSDAAYQMAQELKELGIEKTPDGAPYSMTSIRAAMVGM